MLKILRFLLMVWLGLLAGVLLVVGAAAGLLVALWLLLWRREPAVGFRVWKERRASPDHGVASDVVDAQAHEVRAVLPGPDRATSDRQ